MQIYVRISCTSSHHLCSDCLPEQKARTYFRNAALPGGVWRNMELMPGYVPAAKVSNLSNFGIRNSLRSALSQTSINVSTIQRPVRNLMTWTYWMYTGPTAPIQKSQSRSPAMPCHAFGPRGMSFMPRTTRGRIICPSCLASQLQ